MKDSMCASQALISVIVPVYNVEKYLHKCVDSILNQTYANLEIILVDDGSPDNCGKICDAYANKDKRVSVVHKKNGGQGEARNVGMQMATGEYLAFLDSDDYWDTSYIEKLLSLMQSENADMAICAYRMVDENYIPVKTFKKTTGKTKTFTGVDAAKEALYWKSFGVAPWAKLFKTELWKNIQFKEDRIYEDLATTYLVYVRAGKVAYLDQPLMTYYLRRNSDARMAFNRRKMMTLVTAKEILQFAKECCPALIKAAQSRAVASGFFLYLQIPDSEREYEQERQRCMEIIKENRRYVIFDCRTRKKTWGAAVLSFLGMRTVKRVFKWIKQRSPSF